MNLLTDILTFIGFIAIPFGAAGHITRSVNAREERKHLDAAQHQSVIDALSRLEASIKQSHRLP